MTELLRQAITQIEKLPATEQDSVAARILAELADDQAWAAKFAATTDDQWDRLTESARREIAGGEIMPLDHLFPRGQPHP
jgi:hypothetical protein